MAALSPGDQLRKAVEPNERALFELHHPGIPWDITMDEAQRVVLVNGRAQLHAADAAARASGQKAAA